MKQLDKSILKHVLGILVIALAIGLTFYTEYVLYGIGCIMALLSFTFVGMHIGFMFPSVFMIFIFIRTFYHSVYEPLKNRSLIIAYLVMIPLVTMCYLTTLLVWSYTMYTCLEYSISIDGYLAFLEQISNQ